MLTTCFHIEYQMSWRVGGACTLCGGLRVRQLPPVFVPLVLKPWWHER